MKENCVNLSAKIVLSKQFWKRNMRGDGAIAALWSKSRVPYTKSKCHGTNGALYFYPLQSITVYMVGFFWSVDLNKKKKI